MRLSVRRRTLDFGRVRHLSVLRNPHPHVLPEHEPAHFHAEYQGQHATFAFTGQQTAGDFLPGTALRLIREWPRYIGRNSTATGRA